MDGKYYCPDCREACEISVAQSTPNAMADEPVRVVFHLDQDWNLVSVFCCAVEHQAIHAGFETEAGAQLASAAGDVCRETISQLGGNGEGVDVTLDTFSDRIEIAIHCRGQVMPADRAGDVCVFRCAFRRSERAQRPGIAFARGPRALQRRGWRGPDHAGQVLARASLKPLLIHQIIERWTGSVAQASACGVSLSKPRLTRCQDYLKPHRLKSVLRKPKSFRI